MTCCVLRLSLVMTLWAMSLVLKAGRCAMLSLELSITAPNGTLVTALGMFRQTVIPELDSFMHYRACYYVILRMLSVVSLMIRIRLAIVATWRVCPVCGDSSCPRVVGMMTLVLISGTLDAGGFLLVGGGGLG